MRALIIAASLLVLSGCSKLSSVPVLGPVLSGITQPSPNQWVCYHCEGMSLNGNGSFAFPNSSGAVGYIYTGISGNPAGKTITMTYTVDGPGTVIPAAASGQGEAELRLFLWRKGDDVQCSNTTEWYRLWSPRVGTGGGSLAVGQHTITAVISADQWSDCLGMVDSSGNMFDGTVANLLGVGFTFGAEFFGHGALSTGQNTFTINSFTVQ